MSAQLEPALPLRSRADCVGTGVWARRLALAAGWSPRAAEEISLVVVELGCNAVRHGAGGRCRLSVTEQAMDVEITDGGPGFPLAVLADGGRSDRLGRAGPLAPGERQGRGLGSGLACVRRMASELTLENLAGGGARARATRLRHGRTLDGRHAR